MSAPASASLGLRVTAGSALSGFKNGVVKFVGTTAFAPGEWIGIALDTPEGKNDGSVAGKRYFDCKDKHGLFVRRAQCKQEGTGVALPAEVSPATAMPTLPPPPPINISSAVNNYESSESKTENDEDIAAFWVKFDEMKLNAQMQLDAIVERSEESRSKLINVKELVNSVQTYATNCSHFLVPYDIKRSQADIEKLENDLKGKEVKCLPKKKFRFKCRDNMVRKEKTINVTKQVVEEDTLMNIEGSKTFVDRLSEICKITSPEICKDSQILFRRCLQCVYLIPTAIGSVRLESCEDSFIYLGPCMTVNSHPIVEDCGSLKFAPYLIEYNNLMEDFKTSGLQKASSWDNVVDFRWHKSTQSPNWSLLARECWLKSEVLPSVAEEGGDGITISTKLPEWVKRSSESSESGKDVCSVAEDAAKIKTETRGSSKLHTSAVTSGEAPSTTATPVDDDEDEL